jgi:hypothetical protein
MGVFFIAASFGLFLANYKRDRIIEQLKRDEMRKAGDELNISGMNG